MLHATRLAALALVAVVVLTGADQAPAGAAPLRLVAHDSTGATLYLPGMELHVTAAGAATATRYYTFGGALRDAAGGRRRDLAYVR